MPHRQASYWKVVVALSALFLVGGCSHDVTAISGLTRENSAVVSAHSSASVSDVVIYGPATFTRSTGIPQTETASFAATAGDPITLVITSTAAQGLNATVILNGAELLSTTGGQGMPATIVVPAQSTNELRVRMTGKPGSTITITATVPAPPPPSGLVLHYPLDGNGNDISGSGLDATITNGEWVADRHGNAGSAFHVPTNNAWGVATFPAGSPISFPTSGQFSMSMWVRADSLPSGPESGLIFSAGLSDFDWAFAVRPNGQLEAQVCTPSEFCFSTDANPGDVPNAPLVPGQWVHIAMMYDGAAGRLTFYLGGQRAGYVDFGLSARTTDTEVWFGTAPFATQYWFRGAMDEIRVYNRFLTPAELSALSAY